MLENVHSFQLIIKNRTLLRDYTTQLALPGRQVSKAVTIQRLTKERGFNFFVSGGGLDMTGRLRANQGQYAALRVMTEVAMLELVGKHLALPYWRCVEAPWPLEEAIENKRREFFELLKSGLVPTQKAFAQVLNKQGYRIQEGEITLALADFANEFAENLKKIAQDSPLSVPPQFQELACSGSCWQWPEEHPLSPLNPLQKALEAIHPALTLDVAYAGLALLKPPPVDPYVIQAWENEFKTQNSALLLMSIQSGLAKHGFAVKLTGAATPETEQAARMFQQSVLYRRAVEQAKAFMRLYVQRGQELDSSGVYTKELYIALKMTMPLPFKPNYRSRVIEFDKPQIISNVSAAAP